MSVPTLGHATVNAMFLPNRRGVLKRDTKLRAKAHRMALESVQGDVDTGEPLSMQFSRGQKVDMKKLRQEAARAEYVEKCNRKLVDKMMMIMQGLCGTIVSEQTFPDFNPGTLNYRIRQRELLRIDRANSALLHRLETASSGYNKALLKPKHFQEPHMGLFPRADNSVKSAGSRSGKRTRLLGSSTAPSGGGTATSGRGRGRGNRQLGWDTSVTSVLTEGSAFPTTTLGKFHDASSSSGGGLVGPPLPRQGGGGEREAYEPRSGPPGSPDGGESVDTMSGLSRTPRPPSISSRATCGSTSGRTPSTLKRCRRLARTTPARPGATVFQGGIRVGDEYALLTVTRATEGFGEDGSQGFRLKAYFPLSLAVYTLGIAAAHLPAFTSGSRTAVRQMFQSGEKSRWRWEGVATYLELRPRSDSAMQNSVEEARRAAGSKSDSPRRAEHVGGGERLPAATTTTSTAAAAAAETAAAAAPETPAAVGSSGGLEGTEEKGAEATAAQAAEGGAAAAAAATAMGPGPRFEMVLVPPQDAPVIIIQRLVRGQLMRETYQMLKRAIVVIQAAVRGWKYRMAKRKYEAATKIAAVTRGKRGRNRLKEERAARGIQKHTRSWLRKRALEREQAAKQIQGAVRRRRDNLRREKTLVAREESLLLLEQRTPQTTTSMRGGGGAPRRRPGHKNRPAFPSSKRRSPGTSHAPKTSGSSSTSSSIGSTRRSGGGGGGGGGRSAGAVLKKTTAPACGAVGGTSQGRENQGLGPSGSGNPEKVDPSGGGQRDAVSGGSVGPASDGGTNSNPRGDGIGTTGGGGGRGGGSGVATTPAAAAAAGGKAAFTPPRNQRPRPPDAKDFTRSPYNRSVAGWTRGGRVGGGGGTASKNSPSAERSSTEPRSGAHDGGGVTAGRKDQRGGDAPSGGISVAPPPLPKSSSAAPRAAGAWPSGGAGARTAKAAEAAPPAAGTPLPKSSAAAPRVAGAWPSGGAGARTAKAAAEAPPAAGTSTPAPASQKGSGRSSPRSASGSSKGPAPRVTPGGAGAGTAKAAEAGPPAVGTTQPAPASQKGSGRSSPRSASGGSKGRVRTPPALGKNVKGEDAGGGGMDGAATVANEKGPEGPAGAGGRQSERNPPLARAAPGVLSQVVADEESNSVDGGGSGGSGGGDSTTPNSHRRSSSIPWIEEASTGKHYQPQPRSPSPSPSPSPVKKTTAEPAVGPLVGKSSPSDDTARRPSSNAPLGAGQQLGRGGTATSGGTPEGTAQAKPNAAPQGVAQPSAAKKTEETGAREAVVTGPRRDGAGDNSSNNPNRRTSSVSWAEDLVAGMGGSGASSSPPPKETDMTAPRPADSDGSGSGRDGAGDNSSNNPNRRTSSVSWAEDIVARKREEQVHPRGSGGA